MLVLLLVALAAGYFIGFNRAHNAYLRQQTIYDLHVYPQLYMRLQEGDTNRIASSLRSLIVGPYYYYDTHFSNEVVADAFTNDLAVARTIFNQERAATDEWNHTNRGPNTTLEPTGVGAGSSASRSTSQPAGGSVFGR
jgi:hypothetical protein